MAMAADFSSNHHPPLRPTSQPPSAPPGKESTADVGAADSPKLRQSNLSSPWARVVRGESESILVSNQSLAMPVPEKTSSNFCPSPKTAASAAPSSPPPCNYLAVHSFNANNPGIAASPKKVVWNKPSNGIVEAGSVMDADSWPALSESARVSPKPSADLSSWPVTDGSISNCQGPLTTNSPKKQANSNANPNATSSHAFAVRQRHSRRSGGSGASHSSFLRYSPLPPPPPPPFYPIYQMPPPNVYGNLIPSVPESSPRDPSFRGNHWDIKPVGSFSSQPLAVHDHRNSSRRGNLVPNHHGDGVYPNRHGSRRDQEAHHGNARDTHMQPQRAPPRGFVRPPPPNTTSFVHLPPMRSFPHPMGYQEFIYVPSLPYEPIRGAMPFISHATTPGMLFPVAEPSLPTLIVNQIDYYFSDANLIKDEFLRSKMDDQGWIPLSLIANFPRVKNLTNDVQLISSSLRASTVVEVQDDKVRRCSEWMKWLPTSSRSSIEPGSESPANSNSDSLYTSFENITMEEPAASHKSITSKTDSKPEVGLENCYMESTTLPELPNGDVTQNEH